MSGQRVTRQRVTSKAIVIEKGGKLRLLKQNIIMKIYVYDMVDFEEKILADLAMNSDDEIVCFRERFTLEQLEKIVDADAISILGYSHVDETMLEKMKEKGILYISTRTIGYDHIDVKKAKEMGIKVYNAFYEPNNVADFAVMSMLILLRKAQVSICRALVNDFSLDGMKGREMRSMTVGVIGTGKIGATVVRNLSGFGCKILAYDPYENAKLKEYATYVDLDTLYHESDIITLHTPLTSDNYHMINKESIEKMKDGVIIINTARGALIDTDDLIDALESEKVGGAGIDTLEEEQGIMHVHVGTQIMNNKRSLLYIKQFPNVLYTQHYGFFTEEAIMSMVTCGITSLQDGFYGRESRCEVKQPGI